MNCMTRDPADKTPTGAGLAQERDNWIETARQYARNADYWETQYRVLLPLARAALLVAGWWRTLDAGLRDPETPREVLDDHTARYDNALDLLEQAVSELPDDVAAELEAEREHRDIGA